MFTVSNSALGGKLSLNTIKDCLVNEEAHKKEMGVDINQALVPEGRGRRKSRGPKGK